MQMMQLVSVHLDEVAQMQCPLYYEAGVQNQGQWRLERV